MTLRLADLVIAVNCIYSSTEKYCEEYICHDSSPVDFSVDISESDIEYERHLSLKNDNGATRTPSNRYLETLAVYRKIAERMPKYETVLFHGSVVAVDGEGYMFTARSGIGKSTHSRLWREYFGDRAIMVNDDKPLLRVTESEVIAYGTPWNGKHRLSTNISVPLRGLCALNRGDRNSIEPADKRAMYPLLLQQCYRPRNPAMLEHTLELVDRLSDKVPLWSLHCNTEPDAAVTAYFGMRQDTTAERKLR